MLYNLPVYICTSHASKKEFKWKINNITIYISKAKWCIMGWNLKRHKRKCLSGIRNILCLEIFKRTLTLLALFTSTHLVFCSSSQFLLEASLLPFLSPPPPLFHAQQTPSPSVCETMLMLPVTSPGWYSIYCYFNVLQIRFIHTDLLTTLLFSFLKSILIPLRIIRHGWDFLLLRIFLLLLWIGFCMIDLPHLCIR